MTELLRGNTESCSSYPSSQPWGWTPQHQGPGKKLFCCDPTRDFEPHNFCPIRKSSIVPHFLPGFPLLSSDNVNNCLTFFVFQMGFRHQSSCSHPPQSQKLQEGVFQQLPQSSPLQWTYYNGPLRFCDSSSILLGSEAQSYLLSSTLINLSI